MKKMAIQIISGTPSIARQACLEYFRPLNPILKQRVLFFLLQVSLFMLIGDQVYREIEIMRQNHMRGNRFLCLIDSNYDPQPFYNKNDILYGTVDFEKFPNSKEYDKNIYNGKALARSSQQTRSWKKIRKCIKIHQVAEQVITCHLINLIPNKNRLFRLKQLECKEDSQSLSPIQKKTLGPGVWNCYITKACGDSNSICHICVCSICHGYKKHSICHCEIDESFRCVCRY